MAIGETSWIVAGLTTLGGILGGGTLGAWLAARTKAPADMVTAQAAFQTALSSQADAFIHTLQSHNDALTSRLDDLQRQMERIREENVELREAEQRCRGESAQLRQIIESLEAALRRAGIDVPRHEPPRSFIVIEDGKTTTFTGDPAPQEVAPKIRRRRSKP